jgi:hypothetical protein
VTHIGANFPCTKMPETTASGSESTVWGFDGTDYAVNTDVSLTFTTLTNWGRNKMTPDLTADDDSIQMVIFYNVAGKTIIARSSESC